MTWFPTSNLLLTRAAILISFTWPLLAIGCSPRPRPELEDQENPLYKISFDSSTHLVAGRRALYDTTGTLLTDVLEIGGRALAVRGDTVVISPSYVLFADRAHPGERRTIRKSGHVLPAVVLVLVGPGVDVEPLTKSRVGSIAVLLLGVATAFLYFRYCHW